VPFRDLGENRPVQRFGEKKYLSVADCALVQNFLR
jgi:hypothetical protein